MSDHDSFEDRVRAIADQISRSMQRMADVDLERLAEEYGFDADRARTAAQWFGDRLASGEPLFGEARGRDAGGDESSSDQAPSPPHRSAKPGPHPLDPATERQGLALSALDSGRWTLRPGSNQLNGTGEGPPPLDAAQAPDLVGDLRARDWITADGALTLVGRHALARWCRAADDLARVTPGADTPPTRPGEPPR